MKPFVCTSTFLYYTQKSLLFLHGLPGQNQKGMPFFFFFSLSSILEIWGLHFAFLRVIKAYPVTKNSSLSQKRWVRTQSSRSSAAVIWGSLSSPQPSPLWKSNASCLFLPILLITKLLLWPVLHLVCHMQWLYTQRASASWERQPGTVRHLCQPTAKLLVLPQQQRYLYLHSLLFKVKASHLFSQLTWAQVCTWCLSYHTHYAWIGIPKSKWQWLIVCPAAAVEMSCPSVPTCSTWALLPVDLLHPGLNHGLWVTRYALWWMRESSGPASSAVPWMQASSQTRGPVSCGMNSFPFEWNGFDLQPDTEEIPSLILTAAG